MKQRKFIGRKLREVLNENFNNVINIGSIFNNYKDRFGDEFIDYDTDTISAIRNGLYESLKLIGDGEITKKGDGDLMYEELFNDDKCVLIVHASFETQPYGADKMYNYSIGVYRNDEKRIYYGLTGPSAVKMTSLLGSSEHYCRNKNVISATCSDIKKYVLEKLFNN